MRVMHPPQRVGQCICTLRPAVHLPSGQSCAAFEFILARVPASRRLKRHTTISQARGGAASPWAGGVLHLLH
jgi:hypothetical protein